MCETMPTHMHTCMAHVMSLNAHTQPGGNPSPTKKTTSSWLKGGKKTLTKWSVRMPMDLLRGGVDSLVPLRAKSTISSTKEKLNAIQETVEKKLVSCAGNAPWGSRVTCPSPAAGPPLLGRCSQAGDKGPASLREASRDGVDMVENVLLQPSSFSSSLGSSKVSRGSCRWAEGEECIHSCAAAGEIVKSFVFLQLSLPKTGIGKW